MEPVIQFLRAKSISRSVVKMLQSVEVRYLIGSKWEMEFVKFIWVSASVLEEILFGILGAFICVHR